MTFSHLITNYFICYLQNERGVSPNTIMSYKDGLRQFIEYLCRALNVDADRIHVRSITLDHVLAFLTFIEQELGNSASTRNQRLAGLKTFFKFIAATDPEFMHLNELVQGIKFKHTAHCPPPSLTVEELDAILGVPDTETLLGLRDHALLSLLYYTGARVQELADLTISDLELGKDPFVSLTGKGQKTRLIPLTQDSVDSLCAYLEFRKQLGIESEHLFLNNKGEPMTRFGIGRRVKKYAQMAAEQCPSLRGKEISPHVFRHTCALHMVEADVDIVLVQDVLGHKRLETTSHYVEVSMERKRKALGALDSDSYFREKPRWKTPNIMNFLRNGRERYVA